MSDEVQTPVPGDEWHVFDMDDHTWIVARTLEEAIRHFVDEWGGEEDDARAYARILTEEELDSHTYLDDPYSEGGEERSFRAQLDRLIAEGISKPDFFASTEW